VELERVADRHHPVTGLDLVGVAELGLLQRLRRHLGELNERAVGQRIPADHLRAVFDAALRVVERHRDLLGAFHHVVVGEDEPGLVDDEAGTGSLGARLRAARTPPLAAVGRPLSEEAAQQVVAAAEEFRQLLGPRARLGPDVDDGGRLIVRDRTERLRVDRAGQRRAVHRRHVDRLRGGCRGQPPLRRDHHPDGDRGDSDQDGVEKRGLARGHRRSP
jgi:hypothetical protein